MTWRIALPVALLRLARAHNCAATALMTFFGAYLATGAWPDLTGLAGRAAVVMALLVAACNAYNDLQDETEDRENAPQRPLPSGALTRRQAAVFVAATMSAGLVISASLGPRGLTIALLVTAVGAFYSKALKSTVLAGNAVVGTLSGFTVVYGALAVDGVNAAVLSAGILAGLYVFFREILKTAADIDGDIRGGITTVATHFGYARAVAAARAAAAFFVVAGFVLASVAHAAPTFVPAFAVVNALPTCALIIALRGNATQERLRAVLRVSKVLWFMTPLSASFLRG